MGPVAVGHVNWGTGSESSKGPDLRAFEWTREDGRRRGVSEGFDGDGDDDDDGNGGRVVVVERQRRRAINNDRILSIAVSNRGR